MKRAEKERKLYPNIHVIMHTNKIYPEHSCAGCFSIGAPTGGEYAPTNTEQGGELVRDT